MNVKIDYNVDVTDKARLAIARLTGRRAEGLAARDTVKMFFKIYGTEKGYDMIAEEIGRIKAHGDAVATKLGVTL